MAGKVALQAAARWEAEARGEVVLEEVVMAAGEVVAVARAEVAGVLAAAEEIVDEEMSVFSSVRKLSMMMLTATGLDISEDSEVVQGDK